MAAEKYYPYAIGRIRVIEKGFLSYGDYVRMAEAKTPEEAMRIILDAGYGYSQNEPARNFELLLSQETEKTYALMNEMLPEENFFGVFIEKIDYHNMKVLMKSHFSGLPAADYIISGGKIEPAIMSKAIEDGDFSNLPQELSAASYEALEMYRKTGNGQIIDIILDKAAFKAMSKEADKSQSKFLAEYVKTISDLTNIKSFVRIKKMKKLSKDFEDVYLPGGDLSLEYFTGLFMEEEPIERLKETKYKETGLDALYKSLTEYEKNCDNYIMGIMKKAKYEPLELSALVAYLYAKESEIKTLRIIMTSKLNDIEPDLIKNRLRDAYV